MKIYHISLLMGGEPNHATGRALKSMGDYTETNWINYRHKISELRHKIIKEVSIFKPDIIFMQLQAPNIIDSKTADILKSHSFLVNWTGDVRENIQWYIDLADHVSITLFTNMTDVFKMRAAGKKADYLQVGYDDQIYIPKQNAQFSDKIVFMGNNYQPMSFPKSKERLEMVNYLRSTYKSQFDVYGKGWGGQSRHLNPHQEASIYQQVPIAINQNHFDYELFSSDRILRLMACGAFCLTKYYKGIETEYNIGEHLDTWNDFSELQSKIDYYLNNFSEKRRIANDGMIHVHKSCTWYNRVEQLVKIYQKYNEELDKSDTALQTKSV